MTRRSAPPSSRCVANAWRRRCGWRRSRRTVLVSRRRPRTDRKIASFAPAASAGRAELQVPRDVECGLLAERHDALLAALAAHVDELAVEVDVAEVERDGLGAAEPGGVEELEEGAVAQRERRVAFDELEDRLDLGRLRRVGEPPRAAGRELRVGDGRRGRTCSAGTSERRPGGARWTRARGGCVPRRAPRPSRRGRARRRRRAPSPRSLEPRRERAQVARRTRAASPRRGRRARGSGRSRRRVSTALVSAPGAASLPTLSAPAAPRARARLGAARIDGLSVPHSASASPTAAKTAIVARAEVDSSRSPATRGPSGAMASPIVVHTLATRP